MPFLDDATFHAKTVHLLQQQIPAPLAFGFTHDKDFATFDYHATGLRTIQFLLQIDEIELK
jgi:hypothetical protein